MSYHQILLLFVVVSARIATGSQNISVLNDGICSEKPALEDLRRSGTHIQSIETNALHKCTKLRNILLDDNLLTVLRSNTFKHKSYLVELSLHSNRLEYVDEDVFDGLSALETLNLRCNNLIFFSPRHVQDLMALKYLNLASNHLINLEMNGLLDNVPHLGFISYNGNLISCSSHAVISSKINATGIVLGDFHCESLQNPDLIESTSDQFSANTYHCMPDDKWDLRSTEVIARIDDLKKKYNNKK